MAKKNKDLKRVKKKGTTLISPFQMDNENHDYITGIQKNQRNAGLKKQTIGEVINDIIKEQRNK